MKSVKSLLFSFSVLSLIQTAHAGTVAGSKTVVKYCEDMTRVENFPRFSDDQFQRHLKSKGEVDRILVSKDKRELYLINDEVVLKTYKVSFGANHYAGPKQFEGDGKTPEGVYSIDYKNPQSSYYLALHVSYPNTADKAYASSKGKSAGGDIMVHGFPNDPVLGKIANIAHPGNWTQGCIAVTNDEIEEIFALVQANTTIEICAPTKTP